MSNDLVAANTPPAHVAALMQAEGMNYDPAAFAAMTLEQHADEGMKGYKASVLSAIYSGMHFSAIKDSGNRLITEEADKLGISAKSIYNMIDVYKLIAKCPEKSVKSISHLGVTKLIELKHLDESDLERLSDGEEVYGITLETAQSYSVRELKAVINSHRAEIKTMKQRILDAERKMNTEADRAAELLAENMELKKLSAERRAFRTMRKQLFEDMETLQGIVVRARKVYEISKHLQHEVAGEATEAVVYPLLHLLSVMHGNSKLLMDDCYLTWAINPAIPVNPPQPDNMTHEERWAAQTSARYQDQLTKLHFPEPGKKVKK